jgi:methionyl-tRNA formyltransferase
MTSTDKTEAQAVFLITDRSPWSRLAADIARRRGLHLTHLAWEHGDAPAEEQLSEWKGDWIIGFKADYIVPPGLLAHASRGAINFHPGPPNIRGVGTYEVAMDQNRRSYGVTCHHMTPRVDAGPIIKVRRFRIDEGVEVADLRDMAAAELLALYMQVINLIVNECCLPISASKWFGPLHTWKEFDARAAREKAPNPK